MTTTEHTEDTEGSQAEEVSRNVRKGAKNQKLSGLCGFAPWRESNAFRMVLKTTEDTESTERW
jgi:hypothetical protein